WVSEPASTPAPSVQLDLDLHGLRFGPLGYRHFEHAILVRGADVVVSCILGKREGTVQLAISALRDMNRNAFRSLRARALRFDDQRLVIDANLDRLALQSGHLEREMISFVVFNHIRSRRNALRGVVHFFPESVPWPVKPSARGISVREPQFHPNPPAGTRAGPVPNLRVCAASESLRPVAALPTSLKVSTIRSPSRRGAAGKRPGNAGKHLAGGWAFERGRDLCGKSARHRVVAEPLGQ